MSAGLEEETVEAQSESRTMVDKRRGCHFLSIVELKKQRVLCFVFYREHKNMRRKEEQGNAEGDKRM